MSDPHQIAQMMEAQGISASPEQIQALIDQREQKKQQVQALGQAVSKLRTAAINGRAQSGIEDEWAQDEDAYLGIDDLNRGEASGAGYNKPPAIGGNFSSRRIEPGRSTVFLNITRPYVDAAAARVADMLLPTDDKNWGLKPTPQPDLLAQITGGDGQLLGAGANAHAAVPQLGAPDAMPQQPAPPQAGVPQPAGPQPQPGQPAPVQPQPQLAPANAGQPTPSMADAARATLEQAKAAAEAAETQIEDWLVECYYHAEARKVIEDCAKLGTGIFKGPTPCKRTSKSIAQTPEGIALVVGSRIAPESKRVDPWDFFPDPACGEDIHRGSYVFERDRITARELRDLADLDGYLPDEIDAVLEEGPQVAGAEPTTRRPGNVKVDDDERFDIWYFHGEVERDDMEAAGCDCSTLKDRTIHAVLTMVNDRVIRASLSPLESGDFPYDAMPWARRPGMPWGSGISRAIRVPQRQVNSAARALNDNAGLSAGPQLVVNRSAITPADGFWTLTPRKIWFLNGATSDVQDVSRAFAAITIPSMQQELMNIVQWALKLAEDLTGLPLLMQGQTGANTPDTVGGMVMLQNNASTVLRRIARTFDDCVTEPHIRRYYEWLMLYGDDDKAKGDFQIDARGSTALVERDASNMALLQMGQMVGNPMFGIDPKRWFRELCKAQRIDPNTVQFSDEEIAQQQQQTAPPPDPAIQVAQIRAQAEVQIAKDRQQASMVELQIRREIAAAEHAAAVAKLQLEREVRMLELSVQQKMSIEEVKAKLADTAIKVKAQRDLAAADMMLEQQTKHAERSLEVMKPPTEPPQRAPAGHSFQQ